MSAANRRRNSTGGSVTHEFGVGFVGDLIASVRIERDTADELFAARNLQIDLNVQSGGRHPVCGEHTSPHRAVGLFLVGQRWIDGFYGLGVNDAGRREIVVNLDGFDDGCARWTKHPRVYIREGDVTAKCDQRLMQLGDVIAL